MKQLKHIVMLTQFAISIVAPLLFCLLGSRWLMVRFSLGGWIMVIGILLGIGGAVSGLIQSLKQIQHAGKEEKGPPPISFNEHE